MHIKIQFRKKTEIYKKERKKLNNCISEKRKVINKYIKKTKNK